MVDKLFIVKSPQSLRCSSNISPMLCPIHTGPSFHQGFHTRNGLDFLLAHGHGPVGLVRPYLLFLSSSILYIYLFVCMQPQVMYENELQMEKGCFSYHLCNGLYCLLNTRTCELNQELINI